MPAAYDSTGDDDVIDTKFAERFSKKTGIGELMDDMGRAAEASSDAIMLGGGNPARIPEVDRIWRRRLEEVLADAAELDGMLAYYDTPRGKTVFLEALAGLLNREFGWNLTGKNIAVTNGSQNAFFLLLNLFSGPMAGSEAGSGAGGRRTLSSAGKPSGRQDASPAGAASSLGSRYAAGRPFATDAASGREAASPAATSPAAAPPPASTPSPDFRRVLFPLCPEYIGYADQAIEPGALATRPARIDLTRPGYFKYGVDFDNLTIGDDIAALCVSRPTNPTGNVLTDAEVERLAAMASAKGIPFIIDNAYGAPFPGIIFSDVKPYWDENVILGMSLSKLGLPSVRTGIIIANEDVIQAVSSANAVISLANGGFGQVLTRPMIESGDILRLSREVIRPFYIKRSRAAVESLRDAFGSDISFRIHESEGSIFLWLWLPDLPVSSFELYERLKNRGVIVVSGHYFFYGMEEPWNHADQCLRISYAAEPELFRKAAFIIADEIRRIMEEV